MKATLILENGMTFEGQSIGATADAVFELVFHTGMTGYQEILTDPSHAGQGVVLTYPLIGNYGVNDQDNESEQPWVKALVVRSLSHRGSNFRCQGSLNDYLLQFHITGIEGVDTRALTRVLRSQGTMHGMITCAENFNMETCLATLRDYRLTGLVEQVTCKDIQVVNPEGAGGPKVAILDLGVKRSVVDALTRRGCLVTLFPAHTAAQAILAGGFDGVLLSDGPGDPADNRDILPQVKALYDGTLPLFALGLGHQLLALATGAKTGKMHFGHHGVNQPVKDLATGRCQITSQNHGYEVLADSLDPAVAQVSHGNVSDGGVEGLAYKRPNCISLQFHPEAAQGPRETRLIFDRFVESMKGGAN